MVCNTARPGLTVFSFFTWLFLCLLYHVQEGCNTLGYVSMFLLVLAVPRGNTVPNGCSFFECTRMMCSLSMCLYSTTYEALVFQACTLGV